jgi:GNAT superfamily N-acetyltransferase
VAEVELDERNLIAGILTLAFATDPPTRYVWPTAAEYLQHFPTFISAFGGPAFDLGTASIEDGGAAALWLPPGAESHAEALADLVRASVSPEKRAEAAETFTQMRSYYPATPHWHLALLGVDPQRQGDGLGSRLLQRTLSRLDAQGALAYLENSNPRNLAFYERHGFEVVGEIQVGGYPVLYPMVRPPPSL